MLTPVDWQQCDIHLDADVLMGFTDESMHVVAPPLLRLQPNEAECQRVQWRHVVWFLHGVEVEPAVSIDPPDEVTTMKTVEVVSLLSEQHHDFVRSVMARQLRRAELMGSAPANGCPSDRHAQLSGRTMAWAVAELKDAFPDEIWFRRPDAVATIPSTADELLRRIPPAGSPPNPRHGAGFRLRALLVQRWADEEHEVFADGVRRQPVRKRILLALWIIAVAELVLRTRRTNDRLLGIVGHWSDRLDADAPSRFLKIH